MSAKDLLNHVKQQLAKIKASGINPSVEAQDEIIQTLFDILPAGLMEDDLNVRLDASSLASDLLENGAYGFKKNAEKWRLYTQEFMAAPWQWYSLSGVPEEIACLLNEEAPDSEENPLSSLLSQKIIRILADDAPNHGNQAANVNLVKWLLANGFKGKIQFIYPATAKEKFKRLFDISDSDIPGHYKKLNIEFIEINKFMEMCESNQISKVKLAMTGAADGRTPTEYASWSGIKSPPEKLAVNFANYTHSKVFIKFSPYYKFGRAKTQFFVEDIPDPFVLENSHLKALNVPITTLDEADHYLNSSPTGKKLLLEKPALKFLIESIKSLRINFMSAYGNPLRYHPLNLLNLILGVQYAQKNKPTADVVAEPTVIGAFYDLDQELLSDLHDLISKRKIGALDFSHDPKLNDLLDALINENNFQIINIKDESAFEQLAKLQKGQIALLVMGSISKTVFDGISSHIGPNILPRTREGASSRFSSGAPHIHCNSNMEWDIDLDSAPSFLRNKLESLNNITCIDDREQWQYEEKLKAVSAKWNAAESARQIGEYILAARNPGSTLSSYFKDMENDLALPENNRFLQGFNIAGRFLKSTIAEIKDSLAPYLYRGYIKDENNDLAIPPIKQHPKLQAKVCSQQTSLPNSTSGETKAKTYNIFPFEVEEKLIIVTYFFAICKKYSPYTLPWNRINTLNEEQIQQLNNLKKQLITYNSYIVNQKNSRLKEFPSILDELCSMEKIIKQNSRLIEEILITKKSSSSQLKSLVNKIETIKKRIQCFAEHNRSLHKFAKFLVKTANHYDVPIKGISTYHVSSNTMAHEIQAEGKVIKFKI